MFYSPKTVKILTALLLVLAIAIILFFSPVTAIFLQMPVIVPLYWLCTALFWVLLFVRMILKELVTGDYLKYRSIIDRENRVQKLLVKPTSPDVWLAARIALSQPANLAVILFLLLTCVTSYLMLFQGVAPGELGGVLFGTDERGQTIRSNIWLCTCSLALLLLCTVIVNQNYSLKQSNKLQFTQNLIVKAHSKVSLEGMLLRFVDLNKMFLTANKQEYILNAKPIEALASPGHNALLEFNLEVRLYGEYPLREFYVRQLTIFVDDVAIACESHSAKYHNIYEVNHIYILKCFIHCRDIDYSKLATKIAGSPQITLYYHAIIRNSFDVITDIYGSTVYAKAPAQEADGLRFIPSESSANQQFYM